MGLLGRVRKRFGFLKGKAFSERRSGIERRRATAFSAELKGRDGETWLSAGNSQGFISDADYAKLNHPKPEITGRTPGPQRMLIVKDRRVSVVGPFGDTKPHADRRKAPEKKK